jgi:hypothetical protein
MNEAPEQDTWFVSVTYRSAEGRELFGRKGILDLPHPMTSFDAADYAVRVEVRDVLRPLSMPNIPHTVHAVIWRKRDLGREPGRYQVCGAIAEYDANRDAFMRVSSGPGCTIRKEVGATEGAKFHPLDW